jgi:hypothetical protein
LRRRKRDQREFICDSPAYPGPTASA